MIHQLEADGIQLQFGTRTILSSIYLRVETGKITGLLGRNGQGKSCLMQVMYGTLACEKSVRIDNTSLPEAFKRPELLAYLPQFNFIPKFLSLKRVLKDHSLEFGGFVDRFPEFENEYNTAIGNLSGGGQRLVELYVIARSRSRFALLDEPFTHLSPLQIEKAKQLLVEEKANKGFLVTDHMYKQVLDVSDNLYMLVNGKTHLVKTPADIEAFGYANW